LLRANRRRPVAIAELRVVSVRSSAREPFKTTQPDTRVPDLSPQPPPLEGTLTGAAAGRSAASGRKVVYQDWSGWLL